MDLVWSIDFRSEIVAGFNKRLRCTLDDTKIACEQFDSDLVGRELVIYDVILWAMWKVLSQLLLSKDAHSKGQEN